MGRHVHACALGGSSGLACAAVAVMGRVRGCRGRRSSESLSGTVCASGPSMIVSFWECLRIHCHIRALQLLGLISSEVGKADRPKLSWMQAPWPVRTLCLHPSVSKKQDNTLRTIPAASSRPCRKRKYASYHSLGFSARDVVELLPAAMDANEEGMSSRLEKRWNWRAECRMRARV
jgi:hypothetical protein